MNATELVPYFHPTQIVLVDNDIDFLGNLSLQLEADLAYLLFDSTTKALGYINDRELHAPSRQRFFNFADRDRSPSAAGRNASVTLDTDALLREMHFTDRFSQISVAMVDYAMPQMNGLEFCECIRNPHIKKILFTGVATEADAVDAFNRGIIDRYIRKSEHHVYDNLNRTIRELQYAHIRDTFAAASNVFDVETPELLRDPEVVVLMQNLKTRYGFVEYYLVSNPWGFMLVDGDGRVSRLVLCDERDQAQHVARSQACDAPTACVDALMQGDVMMDPAIAARDRDAECDAYRHWQRHARNATRLRGRREYRWALFEQPAMEGGAQPPVATYNRYLEWLDTVGYSLM